MVFGRGRKNEAVTETFQSLDDSVNLDHTVLEFKHVSSPKRTGRTIEETEADKTPETRKSRFLRDKVEPRSRSKSRGRRIASGALSVVSAAIGVSKNHSFSAPVSDAGLEIDNTTHDDCEVDDSNNTLSPKKRGWGSKIFRGSKADVEALSSSQLLDDTRSSEQDPTNLSSLEVESESESGSPGTMKRRESRSLESRPMHSPRRSKLNRRPLRSSSSDMISSITTDPSSTIFSLYNADSLISRPSLVPAPSMQDGLSMNLPDTSITAKSKKRIESPRRRSKIITVDKKGKSRSTIESTDVDNANGKDSISELNFLVESGSPRSGSQFLPSIILSEVCEDMGNRGHKSDSSLDIKLSESKTKAVKTNVPESSRHQQPSSIPQNKGVDDRAKLLAKIKESKEQLKSSLRTDSGSGKGVGMPPISPRRRCKSAILASATESTERSESLESLDVEVFSAPKARKSNDSSNNKDSPKDKRKSSSKIAVPSKCIRPRGDSRSVCVESSTQEQHTRSPPPKNSLVLLDDVPRKKSSRSSQSVIDSKECKERRKHDSKSISGQKDSRRSRNSSSQDLAHRSKSSDTLTPSSKDLTPRSKSSDSLTPSKSISSKISQSEIDLDHALLEKRTLLISPANLASDKRSADIAKDAEPLAIEEARKGNSNGDNEINSEKRRSHRINSSSESDLARIPVDGSSRPSRRSSNKEDQQTKHTREIAGTVDSSDDDKTVSRVLKMLEDLAPGNEKERTTSTTSPSTRKNKQGTEYLDNKVEKSSPSKSRTRKNALDWVTQELQGDESRRSRSRSPSKNRSRSKSRVDEQKRSKSRGRATD